MDGRTQDVSPCRFKCLQLSLNGLLTLLVAASYSLVPFANGHIQLHFSLPSHEENVLRREKEMLLVGT